MARKPRIHYPDADYHVILRGNAGEPIFFDDRDRYRRYLVLQYAVGDDSFTEDILVKVNQKDEPEYSLDEVISVVCAHYRISEEKLKAPGKHRPMTEARAVAAALVQSSPHLQLTTLAKLLVHDVSALGRAVRRALGDERINGIVGKWVVGIRSAGWWGMCRVYTFSITSLVNPVTSIISSSETPLSFIFDATSSALRFSPSSRPSSFPSKRPRP